MRTTTGGSAKDLMSNWRWWICSLLFFATTINYMDRQVLSLTYEEFIKPQFHWTDADYGTVTSRCSFPQMADIIAATMQRVPFSNTPDYDVYVQTDAEARRVAHSMLNA